MGQYDSPRIRLNAERRATHASGLTEATKLVLENSILSIGGDSSAIFVTADRAEKAQEALHLNFGHRTINRSDISIYNPAEDQMQRFARFDITAVECGQIRDAMERKLIRGGTMFAQSSREEDAHALIKVLETRGH